MTKEKQEQFVLFHKRIALLLTKNKLFTGKTDERNPNPELNIFKMLKYFLVMFVIWKEHRQKYRVNIYPLQGWAPHSFPF